MSCRFTSFIERITANPWETVVAPERSFLGRAREGRFCVTLQLPRARPVSTGVRNTSTFKAAAAARLRIPAARRGYVTANLVSFLFKVPRDIATFFSRFLRLLSRLCFRFRVAPVGFIHLFDIGHEHVERRTCANTVAISILRCRCPRYPCHIRTTRGAACV
jgi:hypothetical protein